MKGHKKLLGAVLLVGALAPSVVAQAGLQSEMNDWFGSSGYVNSTAPGAYESQAGGFYSGGTMSTRVPTRNIGGWVGFQEPKFEGGCGGIDMDLGGFNFVDKDTLVQQFRAIGQNAKGLAFMMAIKYISAQLGTTMDDIKAIADKLNALQMNSCDAAKGLMAAAGDGITKSMDKDQWKCISSKVGRYGMTYDEARTECTGGGTRDAELKSLGNVDSFTHGNLAWFALMQSEWMRNDLQLAEIVMSMTGTLIVERNDPGASGVGMPRYYPPIVNNVVQGGKWSSLAMKTIVDAMVFGNDAKGIKGEVPMWKCDSSVRTPSPESCDKLAGNGAPQMTDMSGYVGIKAKVRESVDGIYSKVRTPDTALTNQERALVESTAIPLYRYILTSASAFGRTSSAKDERLDKYLDVMAEEIVATNLAAMLDKVKYSLTMRQLNSEGDENKARYLKNVEAVQSELMRVREDSIANMDKVIEMMQLSQQYERVIISRMSVATFNAALFGR